MARETEAARSALFSLVSGTTLRFVSRVAAVLRTATYAFDVVYTAIPASADPACSGDTLSPVSDDAVVELRRS